MTDPVADLLTRLRNANSAFHDSVSLPNSKLKTHIAEILKSEGFIADWKVADARVGQTLTIDLKYGPNRERSIVGIKRVSKPGLRIYARADGMPRVLGGMGVAVVSTSQGLVTDVEARKKHLGGEVLCHVW
jgi:small subunit ribosomal protein S8